MAPMLDAIGDKGTSELVELTFTATASDTDVVDNVINTLTFSFDGTVPSGSCHHVCRCIHLDSDRIAGADPMT